LFYEEQFPVEHGMDKLFKSNELTLNKFSFVDHKGTEVKKLFINFSQQNTLFGIFSVITLRAYVI
jgi:hypothetical protein